MAALACAQPLWPGQEERAEAPVTDRERKEAQGQQDRQWDYRGVGRTKGADAAGVPPASRC